VSASTLAGMSEIEDKLSSLGHMLPPPPAAAGNYLPFKRAGNLLFLSGSIAVKADGTLLTGKVGAGSTLEEGYASAQICLLNQLAVIKLAVGSLEKVRQIVTLTGFVNAAPDFTDVPLVINGASDLLVAVFGEAGRHARAAVGAASLPKGVLTEVQLTVEVND
jgi:enamine deaminase RidA (YjgF/YER057c/UK114 family)